MKRYWAFLWFFGFVFFLLVQAPADNGHGSPIPMRGYYGFGDFKNGQTLSVQNENMVCFKDTKVSEYSGWSKPMRLPVGKDSAIFVRISGADSINAKKFLKLFVGIEGRDISLICSDSSKQSDDPTFVIPCSGTLEFKFPDSVVERGEVDKLGFMFASGVHMENVTMEFFFRP